jgi:glycosyltransferase involved in cell wall biosynthesis
MTSQSRVLLIGPVFSSQFVGGLQLAIADVAKQLGEMGWQVEVRVDEGTDAGEARLRTSHARSGLSGLSRFRSIFWFWHKLPAGLRRAFSTPFKPASYYRRVSANLQVMEQVFAGLQEGDIVLYFQDGSAPGGTALAAERCSNLVIVSLGGLSEELNAWWWRIVRKLCRLRFGRSVHPYLFRAVRPEQVNLAAFGSRSWQRQAMSAGLDDTKAETVYFGINIPSVVPRTDRPGSKILWVGRLAPSKGLHLLVDALPDIRHRFSNVTLTAIAAQGQAEYRALVEAMIDQRGLGDIVELQTPVSRDELQVVYAEHDLLFFHSPFDDPAALVLMEAYAAGLPVVASRAGVDAALVREDQTCLCYDPGDRQSLVDAVNRMLAESYTRKHLADTARALVEQSFSLDAMGRHYDALLRERVPGVTASAHGGTDRSGPSS